jgi:hypothetical protein
MIINTKPVEFVLGLQIKNVLVNNYIRYNIMLSHARIIGDQEVEVLILDSMSRVWDVMNEDEQNSAINLSKEVKDHYIWD